MTNDKVLSKLNQLEAHIALMSKHLTVLKSELEDRGTSKSSTRKGVISAKEKAKILAKRQKNRIKKPSA